MRSLQMNNREMAAVLIQLNQYKYIKVCSFYSVKRVISSSIILLTSFPELNNGLSSTEELSLYPENGYARYSHGGLSR